MPSTSKSYVTKKAVGDLNRFDMSSQVVTTNNFGIIKPIYLRYCVPGDKITNCEVREFQRLMPMPAPTFGRLTSITRAFFVPCRSVFHGFNEFISQNYLPYSNSAAHTLNTPRVPFTTVATLNYLFRDSSYSTRNGSAKSFDFYNRNADGTIVYFKFTLKGKRIYDLFNSIGLSFPWITDANMSTSGGNQPINLMPLLAVLKFYYDWIVPSRFIDTFQNVQAFINSTINWTSTSPVPADVLKRLIFELRSWLEDDFFTSAFESPSGQTNQGTTDFSWTSPNNTSTVITENSKQGLDTVTNKYGTIKVNNYKIDDYTLKTLGALQSMLNRGLLAGTKIQTWLETEFGIKASKDALNISTYLGKSENDIAIGDVTSYADTSASDGAYLGQYAGKGIGSGQAHFNYEAKEHGYFIVTNEILPRTTYYQGLAPEFQMSDCYDFFQPEFDNVGVDAIPLRTLCNVSDQHANPSVDAALTLYDSVFGFVPRYASLKTSFDRVSGDFRVPTLNTGLDSWYLARDMRIESGFDDAFKRISAAFCDGSTGTSTNNYDRIFQVTSNNVDHFFQVFYLDVKMSRPMKSVGMFLYPEDEKGRTITVKPNGGVN